MPEPETPVIVTNLPRGTSTFKLIILKILPPIILSEPLLFIRRFTGISIRISLRRYARVLDLEGLVFEVKSGSR